MLRTLLYIASVFRRACDSLRGWPGLPRYELRHDPAHGFVRGDRIESADEP